MTTNDLSPQWLEWAQSMFGDIALDPKERALRFVEEAIELGQATGIDAPTIEKIVARVFSRPAGAAEFDRVRSIPKEEWARRHQAKVAAGFAMGATDAAR